MPSGGARARSGPAPDPNALRRDRDAGEWVTLPASGRTGDIPTWPLRAATPREMELWCRLWRRPQAIMWERLGLADQVGVYVRRFAEAEERGSSVALSTLVRQYAESLGLSAPGLRMLRWRISSDEVAQKRAAKAAAAPARTSAKDRLKAISGGGA
jgi:hypothetical protein